MTSDADKANRLPITAAMMLTTLMTSLDTTIANVALPRIQGSLSASVDQISWVLTSYLIATAVMTPLSGWLSKRIGRKTLLLLSVGGFMVSSMLCGIASNLSEIVVFRVLQGIAGASLMPLSQAMVLDLWPPNQVGRVMSIWGMAMIVGPILGPTLGGWLTDNLSWRWVFYINLPTAGLSLVGLWAFMQKDRPETRQAFDFIGFGSLSVTVGAFQLMLDRGPSQDWFSAGEIWTYAVVGAVSGYLFLAQTLTAKQPFLPRALALDRNFVTANLFGLFLGVLMFSSMALLPPMMQSYMGYTALESGIVGIPRGVGTFLAMLIVGRFLGRVDVRFILLFGLVCTAIALGMMTGFDLSMTATPMLITGMLQGFGMSFLFVPLSVVAFSTLDPSLRAEAAGVYNLLRSLGGSVGISIMQAIWTTNAAIVHSTLAENIKPGDPVVAAALPAAVGSTSMPGLMALNGEVTRQAAMVAYIDDFKVLMILTLVMIPFLLIIQPAKTAREATHALSE